MKLCAMLKEARNCMVTLTDWPMDRVESSPSSCGHQHILNKIVCTSLSVGWYYQSGCGHPEPLTYIKHGFLQRRIPALLLPIAQVSEPSSKIRKDCCMWEMVNKS